MTSSAARPLRRVALLSLALLLLTLAAAPSLAQTAAAPAAPAAAPDPSATPIMGEGIPTLLELFQTSPIINGSILGLSVIALLLVLYLVLSLTSAAFNPARFINDVTKLILNRQFDQAIHLCQTNSHLFTSSIVQRLVENRDKDHAVLMEIIATEGRRRAEPIWNRVGYLAEISNIAPMLGLLGTVVGMIKVFFTLTERVAGPNVAQLSAGIAEAMGTTMFGLIVAIAAGFFYTFAKSRATAALAEAEQTCHTLADHTHRAAADPRLKKIDALAEAARAKVAAQPVA
jgi:biopolymer transport protein ExbB